MTAEQLQAYMDAARAAKKVADKATAGPWELWESEGVCDIRLNPEKVASGCYPPQHRIEWGHGLYAEQYDDEPNPETRQAMEASATARFIAHARQDVPDLAEAVEELVAEVQQLQAERTAWLQQVAAEHDTEPYHVAKHHQLQTAIEELETEVQRLRRALEKRGEETTDYQRLCTDCGGPMVWEHPDGTGSMMCPQCVMRRVRDAEFREQFQGRGREEATDDR